MIDGRKSVYCQRLQIWQEVRYVRFESLETKVFSQKIIFLGGKRYLNTMLAW